MRFDSEYRHNLNKPIIMKYCFDIDGTLCITPSDSDGHNVRYWDAEPIPFMIEQVNRLYDEGHKIIMMTARGRGSGKDWTELTREQLDRWGYKYHEIEPMFHKPTADLFVDDKGISVEEWKKTLSPTKGIIAGAFDLIHPGYIRMFKDAKDHCNHLTVALHEDPTMARPHKLPIVHTLEERREILYSIKYVDNVVVYQSEDMFHHYLESGDYEIRFLGTDYLDGSYTGKHIPISIVWLDREHNYSTSKLKTDIYNKVKGPMISGNYYD